MRLVNNTAIEFSSPLLKDIDNLEYIDIAGKYNCCAEFNQRLTVKDTANSRLCSASYCNYSGQAQPCGDKYPDDCINPQGSYYFRLTNLYFYINGVHTNILDRVYNITQPEEVVTLIADIQRKLPEEVITSVEATYNAANYLCLDIQFLDLPSGIIPEYFILRNDDTCYIKSVFECLEEIPNSKCVKFETKLDLGNVYDLQTVTINDIDYGINRVLDLTLTVEAIEALLIDIEIGLNTLIVDTGVIFTHEVTMDGVFFRYNAVADVVVNNLYLQNLTDANYYNFTFRCVEQTILPVKPIYSTKLYLSGLDSYDTIYAFNVLKEMSVGPVNLLTAPIFAKDIITLPSVLQVVDSTIQMTVTPIMGGYEIVITETENVPYDIIIHSNYSDYKVFSFGVTALLNFSKNYNYNLIEYVHNNLYIKSKFFNFTEEFADGIYGLDINLVTKTDIHNYKFCTFVFNNVCALTNLYEKDATLGAKAILLKELIEDSVSCGCDCETACDLYQELVNILYGNKCLV